MFVNFGGDDTTESRQNEQIATCIKTFRTESVILKDQIRQIHQSFQAMHDLFTLPNDPSLLSYGVYTPKTDRPVGPGGDLFVVDGFADRGPGRRQPRPALDRAGHRQPGARRRRLGHAFHRHAGVRRVHRSRLRPDHHHSVEPAQHPGGVGGAAPERRRAPGWLVAAGRRRAGRRRHRGHALRRHDRHAHEHGTALRPVDLRAVDRRRRGTGHARPVGTLRPVEHVAAPEPNPSACCSRRS